MPDAVKQKQKKAGVKRVILEIPEADHKRFEDWAKQDDRSGGASEAIRVLLHRNIDTLLGTSTDTSDNT